MATRTHVSVGLDVFCCPDLRKLLDEAANNGFDFVCTYIVNPSNKRNLLDEEVKRRPGPLTRTDLILTHQDWGNLVVAKVSPWIQLDSKDENVRRNSELAFEQEVKFAVHLTVPSIVIELNDGCVMNTARMVSTFLPEVALFWVKIPLTAAVDQLDDVMKAPTDCDGATTILTPPAQDTWIWWDTLRTLCDHNKKLAVALELSSDLPPQHILDRWLAEPVHAIIVPTHVFLTNKGGFPVLSKAHQAFIIKLFKYNIQVVVTGKDRHGEKGHLHYMQYMEHLWSIRPPLDTVAKYATGYEDYLQSPLQPLSDNLESQTYETFEQDPIKYTQYQKAIYEALLDRVAEEERETKEIIVMVLGAGRGPLVTATLQAADEAHRKVKVYAVEKNPNAIVTLENKKADIWGEYVTIVYSDMRDWNPEEKADIIVSELLGSFGDNELSPECLDGAQRCLKDDGISIPQEYTSYVAPLSSNKLWNQVQTYKVENRSIKSLYETPYVVRIHRARVLATPQPLFTFVHPNKASRIDNNRYKSCTFSLTNDSLVHGFAGYFSCKLYKDIDISIHPDTHSPGMFSWFPIYIPIVDPMLVRANENLTVQFWRVCGAQNVWYEWCVTEPVPKPIHNPKGRSYTIGL